MEAPEDGDILRGVSLWASVSLYAQWEQKGKGVHPPRATHVAASDPWAQSGTEGRTEGRPRWAQVQGPRQVSYTSEPARLRSSGMETAPTLQVCSENYRS